MDITRSNNKGLSLVEVVLSALMLSVVLGALYATYINANNLISLARNKIIALAWAESVIEGQKDGVSTNDPTTSNMLEVEKSGSFVLSNSSSGQLMRRLKVTVTWTE